ncbi:NAD(P)-dependent oxidoreductase [Nostoc sp. TCL26-01]|uniref:NAD-dependent epimerase/dehydratase family protein n=1 Tax=Nostoc sp. TCL26-01 TaxID=2576904 RepID=UPI0015B7CDA0|nr:NAD(P)-dependent oxidoreductase [Nostoc sp. TCL26-01]QLE58461.1 NAD(P)-dependent oxidoreductase [Nostoc sp. TCL26-01]
MKLLVTGASGFLGQYVVLAALQRGHQVRVVIRPNTEAKHLPWYHHPSVEIAHLDLRQQNLLATALQGIDVVIHLVAAKTGDFDTQYASTVVATESLLAEMVATQVLRLVAISTFSVFDYLHIPAGTTIDEDTMLVQEPEQRDIYAQVKLIQENLFRKFEQEHNGQVTIIRPGMIYGQDNLWNACLGVKVSDRLWIRIGANAQMPLTYVENCAEAIILATESQQAIGETLNIVDDDLPTQKIYAEKIGQLMKRSPYTIPITWTAMRLLTQAIWQCNMLLLSGKVKLPGILVPARLHARFKPLFYTNRRAHQILNWQPKYSLDAALERSCHNIQSLPEPSILPLQS